MAILPLQIARVSNLLRTSVSSYTLTKTQQSLLEVQNELTTGKKLNAPSDNPGDAAIAQQIHKLLEQRQAYSTNLQQAGTQLGQVDSTLGDLTDMIKQAQQVASANVGSDVSSDARASAATVVDALYRQIFTSSNTQLAGVYIFGGDRATDAPFVEVAGGVKFVGSNQLLKNTFDESTTLSFQVDGDKVFGATSDRVNGSADLTPSLALTTRLSDLRGTTGDGVHLGSIQLGDGTGSAIVDLSKADTVGDVVNAINAAGVGSITASLSPDGMGISLTGGPTDNITVDNLSGGTTASDLGILNKSGAGAGITLDGSSLQARVTDLTPLANLRGGVGIDTTGGLTITNGLVTKNIDLGAAVTVQDMLNAINGSGTQVRAEINDSGTGINIINPTQGIRMTIAENGGTTAQDLGVRSFGPDSPLSELNQGKGVRTIAGGDFQITDSAGATVSVDVSGLNTIQDVIDAINTAAAGAGAGVVAGFSANGNGLELTDTAAGAGTLSLKALNYSNAATDLGLDQNALGNVITGKDVNPVEPGGVFSHLSQLRDALRSNDQQAITAAAEGLQKDYDRIVQVRGDTGARIQEIESRQNRLDDQNVATKSLLSSLEDVDFNDAISRFQTLQTSLQASLQTAGKVMNLSLLDFLG